MGMGSRKVWCERGWQSDAFVAAFGHWSDGKLLLLRSTTSGLSSLVMRFWKGGWLSGGARGIGVSC
jgi:hypothetical protein